MKSSFIRILSIMTLATSISSFALSEKAPAPKNTNSNDAKSEATTEAYTRGGPETATHRGQSSYGQEKSPKEQQIEQQDKQWVHDLTGIYGG
jgi:hypothetical protein